MAQQNTVTRRAIEILDALTLQPVTGLTISALTITLKRESSGTLVSASETVTLSEIGTGLYWLEFTPENTGVYRLTFVPDDPDAHVVAPPDGFQVDVVSWAASGGPYLCTLADVKEALNIDVASHDDLLTTLIRDVTSFAETYCRRALTYSASVTEYHDGRNFPYLHLKRWPIASVASLHVSTALPRVYGADQLKTEGTDFFVDTLAGMVQSVNGCYPPGPQTVKVVYSGGYNPVPDDLKRAAIEVIQVKWKKGVEREYHITSASGGEGSVTGIRFDDIPMHSREVFDYYRVIA